MTNREKLQALSAGWQPPVELQWSRPRPVRFTVAGRLLVVMAILMAAGGIALGLFLEAQRQKEQARTRLLAETTSRAQARITRLWRTRGKERRCQATYEYSAAGAVITRTGTIPCATWNGLREGEERTVRFVESDPHLGRLEGIERISVMPMIVPFVPVLLLPFFAVLLARDLSGQRRLLEGGRPAPAMVTKLGIRTDKGRKVYYEFLTYGGSVAKGGYGPAHKRGQLDVGARLTVVYDPDNPKRNKKYPLLPVAVDR